MSDTPDPRKGDACDEIDEELLFHLERRQQDLESQGLTQSDAARESIDRFGSIADIRRQCLRAKEGRFPVQRIILAASILIAISAGAAAVALKFEVDRLRSRPMAGAMQLAPLPERPQFVYVSGSAARPGAYAMPGNRRMTLRGLLADSGAGPEAQWVTVSVRRRAPGGAELREAARLTKAELSAPHWPDLELKSDDLVEIR